MLILSTLSLTLLLNNEYMTRLHQHPLTNEHRWISKSHLSFSLHLLQNHFVHFKKVFRIRKNQTVRKMKASVICARNETVCTNSINKFVSK